MFVSMLAAAALSPSGLEIRACPARHVHSFPLDEAHGLSAVLVQNLAIVNRGSKPVTLERIALTLSDGDRALEESRLDAKAVAAAAATGQALAEQKILDLYAFQFCNGRLLDGAALATGATLAPGQAILVMQRPFAFTGKRDRLEVTAGDARLSLPIDMAGSKTALQWPLKGRPAWIVANGPTFHTAHRWAVPEEFALDIVALDESGSTHRGKGQENRDSLAYGAEVVAAADGVVAKVVDTLPDTPPMIRSPGESMDQYYARLLPAQAARFQQGIDGVVGNVVVIDHGNGEFSHYAHLAPKSVVVKVGQKVAAGTALGRLGSSGNSTEPHLHFQLCDAVNSLDCAGIPLTFTNVELPLADGPRVLQSGDIVRVTD